MQLHSRAVPIEYAFCQWARAAAPSSFSSAHSYRQLSAVCGAEDVHEHTRHPPTKSGPRKLTERRMVGIFVIGGFLNLATAGDPMLPRRSQVEQPTYPWLLPATSATNTQLSPQL